MSATKTAPFPLAKIRRVVQGVLPKGQPFRVQTEDSGIEDKRVVRVVTPAWKTLSNPERISKVLRAMQGELSPSEQSRIFRLSVLTERQFRDVVLGSTPCAIALPAKRKIARNRKAAADAA